MTNYILEITLQSPLTSAAGEGRVGLVDRDIAFDDLGLPILPGRRLKGLWREAYRDITEAWQQCGESPLPVEQVFGESGQRSGHGDTSIYIANAELEEAPTLKAWLKFLQYRNETTETQKLHFDDVVQHYTGVRAQTAIDRETGSAKEDTLRLTRTLKANKANAANLVFRARVHFVKPLDKLLQDALALGAVALQYMGTARTRGLGKVSCRLLTLNANGTSRDLTPALNQPTLPSITRSSRPPGNQRASNSAIAIPRSALDTPTHVLRYRLKLTSAVVVPVTDSDPNTVVTRQDIPGSYILGAAAWHYLRQANHTPADKEFRHAFLDGKLRFLTAYPESCDTPQRLIPIPHSVRQFKNTGELIDLVEVPTAGEPTKRLDARSARINQGALETQSVNIELNYHHTRASDRRKGRALGAAVPAGGVFFKYQAIQKGQSFQGAILGSETDLRNLQTWVQDLNVIRLGRSRSAQYGEAEFAFDGGPQALSNCPEWNGFLSQQVAGTPDTGRSLIITALSPLLTVNDAGHPEPRFPESELAAMLGVDTSEIALSASYTRTEVVGGYHAHLSLPRQQWPAIGPGSVFVFELKRDLDEAGKDVLAKLEKDGLGFRRGEGYGRIAINRQGTLNLSYTDKIVIDDPTVPYKPDSEIPEPLLRLLRGVVEKHCLAEIQELALVVARNVENIPSNSLLGRLRFFLQKEPNRAVEALNNLRNPAKESLTNCRINTRERWSPNTLYTLFEMAWRKPETLMDGLIQRHAEELLSADTFQALVDQFGAEDRTEMWKFFLNHLLTLLYRKQRS